MIFVNKKDNRVILSVRKCGWSTLAHWKTGLPSTNNWHNYSSSKKWEQGNPDKGGDTSMPWDNSFWKDYNITLVIRDPIERYVSGIAQLFKLDGHGVDVSKYNNWWKNLDKSNLSFNVTKARNFIDGYSSIRKLSDEEKRSIKVLSQGAALRFLLTRVFDTLNTVEGAIVKVKDPLEYLKRLEFHKNSKNYEDYFF